MCKKRLNAKQKAAMDMFLSMRELATVTGFGENKLNALKKKSGFPLFEGKTTLSKFREWAFANANSAEETAPCSRMASNRPHSAASKSYEPFR
jgi:hypothetical protein